MPYKYYQRVYHNGHPVARAHYAGEAKTKKEAYEKSGNQVRKWNNSKINKKEGYTVLTTKVVSTQKKKTSSPFAIKMPSMKGFGFRY
jgi:hypothetical protein